MENDWVNELKQSGDEVEKIGIIKYKLGETFPNYAVFWGKYIRQSNNSKFETIFKYHYSVFYHMVTALIQNERVNELPLLDIGSPFAHLATVIDLTHRVFMTLPNNTNTSPAKRIEKDLFEEKVKEYWDKKYEKDFSAFKNGFGRPVSIKLHDTESLFNERIGNIYDDAKEFQRISTTIRGYRNKLVHDLSPLKVYESGKVYIPKEEFLEEYRKKSWLYKLDKNELHKKYVLAETQISRLANMLSISLNNIWKVLLRLMNESMTSVPDSADWYKVMTFLATTSMANVSGVDYSDSDENVTLQNSDPLIDTIFTNDSDIPVPPWMKPSSYFHDESTTDGELPDE